MKMHKPFPRIACATLLAAGVAMTPALASANAASAKQPSVGMAQARRTALKALPGGKIAKEELEKEGGGSGLRYSFDVKKGGAVYEVGVDAMTGKVLEKTRESSKDEAAERAGEAREKD